jgi:hypothetical protein
MGGEDRQPRVLQRDEAHQDVVVLALAADLRRVDARGLVAVMAVRDQQLGGRQGLLDGGDRRRVADAPQPVRCAVLVGQLAEGRAAQVRRERGPRVAVVEREDR